MLVAVNLNKNFATRTNVNGCIKMNAVLVDTTLSSRGKIELAVIQYVDVWGNY
jgi:hypothetical protein